MATYPVFPPIAAAPNEVLALIFKEAADTPLQRHETPLALALAGVSRRWRALALGSPELWTAIHISASRGMNTATLFLRRSRWHAFRLTVNTEHSSSHPDALRGLDAPGILELILPHLHRCAGLALRLSDDELSAWCSRLLGAQMRDSRIFRRLRELNVGVHSYPPDELWGPPPSVIQFTTLLPDLRSLRIAGGPRLGITYAPLDTQSPLEPTLARLTTLNVRCTWDGAFIRYVCAHAHALQTLVLRDYISSVFAHGADARASLPALEALVIEFRHDECGVGLADGLLALSRAIDLPSLFHLRIVGPNPDLRRSSGWWAPTAPKICNTPPGVGDAVIEPLICLRELSLDNITLLSEDVRVLHVLCAPIKVLRIVDVRASCLSLNATALLTPFTNLHTVVDPGCTLSGTPSPPSRIIVESQRTHIDIPGEMGFFADTENAFGVESTSTKDFEQVESSHACDPGSKTHACSDFCTLHDPWADTRTVTERRLDILLGTVVNRIQVEVSGVSYVDAACS